MKNNIANHILNSFKKGEVYVDNAQNKALNRVGKPYDYDEEDNHIAFYHKTQLKNLKNWDPKSFDSSKINSRVGNGLSTIYNSTENTKAHDKLKPYGTTTIKYTIAKEHLKDFLSFDPQFQSKSLEEQLSPYKDEINKFIKDSAINELNELIDYYNKDRPDYLHLKHFQNPDELFKELKKTNYDSSYIQSQYDLASKKDFLQENLDLYKKGKLKQLLFLEKISPIVEKYFKGAMYDIKGTANAGGFPTGTDKTAIIFDSKVVNYKGIKRNNETEFK